VTTIEREFPDDIEALKALLAESMRSLNARDEKSLCSRRRSPIWSRASRS
jgi:hypothetical protein